MFIGFVSYSALLHTSPVCGGGGSSGSSLGKKTFVSVHLPSFKINLQTLLPILLFSQLFCLNLYPNVTFMVTIPKWDSLSVDLVKSETVALVAKKARKGIYVVLPKAPHRELYHLQG